MNTYPFLIRSPGSAGRVRRIKVEGLNYGEALSKTLSIYPAKFVNFKYAKNMDLITVKEVAKQLSKSNKGIEYTIWLNKKEGEFYISYPNEKQFPMFIEEENDPVGIEIGSARLNKFDRQAVFIGGAEITPDKPATEKAAAKKVPASERKGKLISKSTIYKAEASENADVMKTKTKKAVAKKPAAKKEKVAKEKTIARGNNMFLTEVEWKKVDAILAKENVSFSAWSRGLVQKRIA